MWGLCFSTSARASLPFLASPHMIRSDQTSERSDLRYVLNGSSSSAMIAFISIKGDLYYRFKTCGSVLFQHQSSMTLYKWKNVKASLEACLGLIEVLKQTKGTIIEKEIDFGLVSKLSVLL